MQIKVVDPSLLDQVRLTIDEELALLNISGNMPLRKAIAELLANFDLKAEWATGPYESIYVRALSHQGEQVGSTVVSFDFFDSLMAICCLALQDDAPLFYEQIFDAKRFMPNDVAIEIQDSANLGSWISLDSDTVQVEHVESVSNQNEDQSIHEPKSSGVRLSDLLTSHLSGLSKTKEIVEAEMKRRQEIQDEIFSKYNLHREFLQSIRSAHESIKAEKNFRNQMKSALEINRLIKSDMDRYREIHNNIFSPSYSHGMLDFMRGKENIKNLSRLAMSRKDSWGLGL